MTDEELSNRLGAALTLSETDRARLSADFKRRKTEEESRLWRVVFRAIKHSQNQLNDTLTLSRAASEKARTLLSKG